MINFCHLCFLLNRMLWRSLAVGAFTTIGLGAGLVPEMPGRSSALLFGVAAVYAQEITDAEVTNYARAVLKMEPVRQEAYDEIKKIIGSNDVPPIVCHKSESLEALPEKARNIAINFCKRSKEIVESNDLSIGRFNSITVNVQSNSNLETRVQSELLRIQNRSGAQ